MPDRPEPWLLTAVSGRALAASAARGGHSVVVLDLFGDRDTRLAAAACQPVAAPGALRFNRRLLLAAAEQLAPAARSPGLVYGAGFEGRIPLLQQLAADRRLFGNPASILARVRDPRRFFPLVAALGIRHPEVRFEPPADPVGWLVKSAGGAGGAQVRRATRRPPGRGRYFQRCMEGESLSVLFLADGRRASVIGFNRQWTSDARPEMPFLFGGAVGRLVLPPPLIAEIGNRLDALVAATGLLGLNGVDFLRRDAEWLVLEVNPRPTATMELYDPDYPGGLFEAHLQACRGEISPTRTVEGAVRAMANVFTSVTGIVPAEFSFPDWCRDIPQPGTRLSPGDPLCSVHAEAADAAAATALVRHRQAEMERALLDQLAPPVTR